MIRLKWYSCDKRISLMRWLTFPPYLRYKRAKILGRLAIYLQLFAAWCQTRIIPYRGWQDQPFPTYGASCKRQSPRQGLLQSGLIKQEVQVRCSNAHARTLSEGGTKQAHIIAPGQSQIRRLDTPKRKNRSRSRSSFRQSKLYMWLERCRADPEDIHQACRDLHITRQKLLKRLRKQWPPHAICSYDNPIAVSTIYPYTQSSIAPTFPLTSFSCYYSFFIISIQNMQSRTRKNLRAQCDGSAVIRQLENDFEVFEYLKENQLESVNIQEYARLYNAISAGQQDRRGVLMRMQAELQQLRSKEDGSGGAFGEQRRRETLEGIQERTCKEVQISNQLEKEIVQTKKSLNLLQGDIGHLVSRNESAKLLSSKISKVKIVAEDQLKRVTLAFIKDKEEIKLRNQMQKKFSKKLKNVSNYESSSLSRLKRNYAESQLKKQEVFEKLLASQKMSENEEEAQLRRMMKGQKDGQNGQEVVVLHRLASVTSHFSINKLAALQIDPNELLPQVVSLYEALEESVCGRYGTSAQMEAAANGILEEYHKLQQSIKAQSQFYQQLLLIKKESKEKLEQLEHEEAELTSKFNIQLEETYKVDQQSEAQYQVNLKMFGQVLSALFVLLSYLEKNIAFNSTYPLQHRCFSYQQQEQPQQQRRSIAQAKNPVFYNYISCLHRVNQLLSRGHFPQGLHFTPSKHIQEISEFYEAMLEDIKHWFSAIRQRFTEKYLQGVLQATNNGRNSITRHSIFGDSRRTTHFKKQSSSFQQDEEDIQDYEREEVNYMSDHCSEGGMGKSSSMAVLALGSSEATKAKRIKLLQGIDSDYYKMIKSTIKMEKENTRKNYQFLRTFKRAKYASRDNILEEKRFQSSFSVLFTKQSIPNLSKTSKFDCTSTSTGFNRFTETITKNRSFFKKPTNHFNLSGTTSPPNEARMSVNKDAQDAAIRRSRMAEKLKLAMQFT